MPPRSQREGISPSTAREKDTELPKNLFQIYIDSIKKIPRLSREKIQELALDYAATKNPKSREALINSQLLYVVQLAHRYINFDDSDIMDFIQAGNVGLIKAVEKFDPQLGYSLTTYASFAIRSHIFRHIMDTKRITRLGTTDPLKQVFFRLADAERQARKRGLEPTDEVVADIINVSNVTAQTVRAHREQLQHASSLDITRADNSDKKTFGDTLADNTPSAEETLAREDQKRIVHKIIESIFENLPPRQQDIITDRLLAEEPLTLKEIGEKYHVSRERPRQEEARLIERIKRLAAEKINPSDI